ncbi:PREDICTED: uncharacterized protein LOC103597390 [Galeopterus variegatus]|uniref:Uncharacterized protein LOC103597390 n=1 Tax=Galeopterus variegatus TaxID=482537 RepID=A0ABM0RFP9_GALVR|nr:PREDICTED: uncharacterized protein LOC103597390 [Galeopterus variegatus]
MCWQGHAPSRGCGGGSFLVSSSFWRLLAILGTLARGSINPKSQCHHMAISLYVCQCLNFPLLLRTPVIRLLPSLMHHLLSAPGSRSPLTAGRDAGGGSLARPFCVHKSHFPAVSSAARACWEEPGAAQAILAATAAFPQSAASVHPGTPVTDHEQPALEVTLTASLPPLSSSHAVRTETLADQATTSSLMHPLPKEVDMTMLLKNGLVTNLTPAP